MEEFGLLLKSAKRNDEGYINVLLDMYKPLLVKEAVVDGVFNEDLFQELQEVFVKCIKKFKVE